MLLKLLPESVSRQWAELAPAIEKAIPAEEKTPNYMTNMLEYILRGFAQVWISYDPNEGNRPHGVIVTTPMVDGFSGHRNLLIVATAKFDDYNERAEDRYYYEAIAALLKYAKSRGFRGLSGYINSTNKYLIERVKQMGAHDRFYFLI